MSVNSPNITPPNPDWYYMQQLNPVPPDAPKRHASPDDFRNARARVESPQPNLNGLFAAQIIHQVPIHPVWHEQALNPEVNADDEGLGYQGRWLFSRASPASSDAALGSDGSIHSNHSNADFDENIQN